MIDANPYRPAGYNDATSVLVVGGSLVGLSMATFLAWHDVPVILVERHPGTSPHPRAVGYTPRTMELLRSVGIQDQIPEVPADFTLLRARVESLTGQWFGEPEWRSDQVDMILPDYSISRGATIAQDGMEPILRRRALHHRGALSRGGGWRQQRHPGCARYRAARSRLRQDGSQRAVSRAA